jgi:hypothetical protein
MASQTFKLQFQSHNALELIDLAFIRAGRKANIPRLRQLDDRATNVYFSDLKGNEEIHRELQYLYAALEGFPVEAKNSLDRINDGIDRIIKSDPLFLALQPKNNAQNVTVKIKTPLGGAMLRTLLAYDQSISTLIKLNDSGYFSQKEARYRELINSTGKPVRVMLDSINITLIEALKWLDSKKQKEVV